MRNARWASGIVSLAIGAISFYFAAVLGYDAYRIFMSPFYGLFGMPVQGLDGTSHTLIVYGLAHVIGLGPSQMIQVAAFLGGVKLTAAVVFAFHVVERIAGISGHRKRRGLVEGGLIIVFAMTGLAAVPLFAESAESAMRAYGLNMLLVAIGAVLCALEHNGDAEEPASPAGAPAPRQAA